jgi:hypothetical protein
MGVLRNVEGEYRHEPYVGIGRSSGEIRMQQRMSKRTIFAPAYERFLVHDRDNVNREERSMARSTVKGVRSNRGQNENWYPEAEKSCQPFHPYHVQSFFLFSLGIRLLKLAVS